MKTAIPLFALAAMFVALAFIRAPDSVRSVDMLSLLGAGLVAGVLLMRGISAIRAGDSS